MTARQHPTPPRPRSANGLEGNGIFWAIYAKPATQCGTVALGPVPHAILVNGANQPVSDTPQVGLPANPARTDARPRRDAGQFRDEHRRDLFPVTDLEHHHQGLPRPPASAARTHLPARRTGQNSNLDPDSDPRPGRCSSP